MKIFRQEDSSKPVPLRFRCDYCGFEHRVNATIDYMQLAFELEVEGYSAMIFPVDVQLLNPSVDDERRD